MFSLGNSTARTLLRSSRLRLVQHPAMSSRISFLGINRPLLKSTYLHTSPFSTTSTMKVRQAYQKPQRTWQQMQQQMESRDGHSNKKEKTHENKKEKTHEDEGGEEFSFIRAVGFIVRGIILTTLEFAVEALCIFCKVLLRALGLIGPESTVIRKLTILWS